jgi:hypothetical protein
VKEQGFDHVTVRKPGVNDGLICYLTFTSLFAVSQIENPLETVEIFDIQILCLCWDTGYESEVPLPLPTVFESR